jgi:hypothetical protein
MLTYSYYRITVCRLRLGSETVAAEVFRLLGSPG